MTAVSPASSSQFADVFGTSRGRTAHDLADRARRDGDWPELLRLARDGAIDETEILSVLREAAYPPEPGLREVLSAALYRNSRAGHVIVHCEEAGEIETLHLTPADLRTRLTPEDGDMPTACGLTLPQDRCFHGSRGQWRARFSTFSGTQVRICEGCEAASAAYAECAETADYPVLSAAQRTALNVRLSKPLEPVLRWALTAPEFPEPALVKDRLLGVFVDELIDLLAEHLGAHPRKVLRDGVLDSKQYDTLVTDEHDEDRVCEVLTKELWAAALRAYTLVTLTGGQTPPQALSRDATDMALRALRRQADS